MKGLFSFLKNMFGGKLKPDWAQARTTASGLRILDVAAGTGPETQHGQAVSVHYTGWLAKDGQPGKKFDSSRRRGPFTFALGHGRVIRGWDEGVMGMRVGGKRLLWIPSELGYGKQGAGAAIPPGADLIFEVEVVALK